MSVLLCLCMALSLLPAQATAILHRFAVKTA
jgi:hypothetical protein